MSFIKRKYKKSLNRPGTLIIILALGLFTSVFPSEARAEALTCIRCGKTVTGKYVSAGDRVFHKDCFTCAFCEKPLKGRFSLDGDEPYHPDCYLKAKNLVCDYCNKVLNETWMDVDGKKYHPGCYKNHVRLRCDICGKPIQGPYVDKGGHFHESCFREHKLDRCAVCSQPIEGRHLVDAWGNKAHARHDGRPVDLCDSCGRIVSKKSSRGGTAYSDGRIICGYCRKTAVIRLSNTSRVQRGISDLLASVGIQDIPGGIPLNLVDLDTLRQKSGALDRDSARGFTVSNRYVKTGREPWVEHTIFILKGLPNEEFKAVLAHEMLHVWLIENNVNLSDREMEGFCNLGAMLVYQRLNSAFSGYHLKQLETNPDAVYGDGYRIMKFRLDHMGWKGLIEDLLK